MATIINISGGGWDWLKNFGFTNIPAGNWQIKNALLNGDVWPGFSSNVIPLCMNLTASFSGGATGGTNSNSVSYSFSTNPTINGIGAGSITGSGRGGVNKSFTSGQQATGSASGSINIYNVWLPRYFNNDLTALQAGITSGTISMWLEK